MLSIFNEIGISPSELEIELISENEVGLFDNEEE